MANTAELKYVQR